MTVMRVYLLKRRGSAGNDEASGFVAAAASPSSARQLAAADAGDEGEGTWLDPARSTCRRLDAGTKQRVILRDFRSGG